MQDKSRIDPELVEDFVNKAHSNLDRVRDLLIQHATIVNAAWDWGGGDWGNRIGRCRAHGTARHRTPAARARGSDGYLCRGHARTSGHSQGYDPGVTSRRRGGAGRTASHC